MNFDLKSGSASYKRKGKKIVRVVKKKSDSELWNDTYRWRWPVEKDGSVADGFVTLEDKPDTEREEE